MRQTFRKPERLRLKKEIESLFSAGSRSVTIYPLRATCRTAAYSGSGPHVKVLLSVAKRRLRQANMRNRAKRQLREAYRLQKQILTDRVPDATAVSVAFIWLAESPVSSATINKCMQSLLQRISERALRG